MINESNLILKIKSDLKISHKNLSNLLCDKEIINTLAYLSKMASETISNNSKIIFCGNGGSAAEAQHFSAELVSKFNHNRSAINSIALTTDTSAITSIGNDYGYEYIFSRQLEALANPGDLFIAISTSGKSPNITNAISWAINNNIKTSLWTGNLKLQDLDSLKNFKELIILRSTSKITSIIQEQQLILGHIFCGILENYVRDNEL